jgi:hypothetical protein|tara:strand:- start:800 stop:1237 length:438 start_codon:yes stop_codon:yes gene_type:complete
MKILIIVFIAIDLLTIPIIKKRNNNQLTWDDFVEAVIQVESRGNDLAYNERENAVGCLQIRPIMVKEVNRVLKTNKSNLTFTLNDRWDRQKSIDMFDIIADEIYCCVGLSQMEFFEIVARQWNGGPSGHKKTATIEYWNKIKKQL